MHGVRWSVWLFGLSLFLCGSLAHAQDSWSSDLLAYWAFDEGSGEKVADYRGESTGQKKGNAYWLTGSEAKFGSAMHFNSSDVDTEGYVALQRSAGLANPTAGAMTISVWLKTDKPLAASTAGPFASVFNCNPATKREKSDNYILYYDQKNSELRAKFTNSGDKFVRPGIPAIALPVEKWYHVAAVYDGNSASMYLNGEKKGQMPLGGTLRDGQISAIGRKGENDEQYWHGEIDDLAIWKRALTAEEIKTLAEGKKSLSDLLSSSGTGGGASSSSSASTKPRASTADRYNLLFFFDPTNQETRAFYDGVIRKNSNYELIKNYDFVLIDMKANKQRAIRYDVRKSPTIILEKPDGTAAWKKEGVPEEEEFLSQLKRFAP